MSIDVVTFGCRLNLYESQAMKRQAHDAGLTDTVIVNTCAVTAEAVRQAKQTIRRIARERPNAQLIVTGCAAQTEPETFASIAGVSRVIGNDAKLDPQTWRRTHASFGVEREEKIIVNDIMAVKETAMHLIDGVEGHARAFVQIQNGCDHRCTFCIIPFGRGNSRSAPMGDVVAQIRRLVENNYREIVLTGVDITSYGSNLPGAPKLGRLIKQIFKHVPELERLRLSSIDSVEADADLLDVIATDERLMPHLHLSLQAGDNLILKRMKRRHAREDAIAFCDHVRRLRPDMVFGADIIAGFPTETEDMFARSLDLVEKCGLTRLHVFPFSPRNGTPAARMPQLPRPLVKARARRLREKGEAAFRNHLDKEIGATRRVLIERNEVGRTEHFTPIAVKGFGEPGSIVTMRVSGHDGAMLLA